MPPGENARVIGAMAIRLRTVRPLRATGRDNTSAAREADSAEVTVTWVLLDEVDRTFRLVCAKHINRPLPPQRRGSARAFHRPPTSPVTRNTPEGGTPRFQGVPP